MKNKLITLSLVLASFSAIAGPFDLPVGPDPVSPNSLSLSPQMGTPMDSQLMSRGINTGGSIDQWQDSSLLGNIGNPNPNAAPSAFGFYATDGLSNGTPILPTGTYKGFDAKY